MKYYLLIFIILQFITLIFAQEIPNADFENWDNYGSYDNPTNWDTPNEQTAQLGKYVAIKGEDNAFSGNYYLQLISENMLLDVSPGLATLGDFNLNMSTFEATISDGISYTSRPETFRGYFQYFPEYGDNCFIGILLLKNNGTDSPDTIGDGNFTTTATINTWTNFSINISYRSNETPDFMNIILLSSEQNAPEIGSTLYIDALSLTMPQNILFINNFDINLFPNPAKQFDNINITINKTAEIDKIIVYNSSMQEILQYNIIIPKSTYYTIPLAGLKKGIYFLRLYIKDGFYIKKIVVY